MSFSKILIFIWEAIPNVIQEKFLIVLLSLNTNSIEDSTGKLFDLPVSHQPVDREEGGGEEAVGVDQHGGTERNAEYVEDLYQHLCSHGCQQNSNEPSGEGHVMRRGVESCW